MTFPIPQPADNAPAYTYTQPIRDSIAGVNDHQLRLNALDGISVVGNAGSSISLTAGANNGCIKLLTLNAASCAISFNTFVPFDKARSLELVLTQDGIGGRLVTWGSPVKWAGGTPPVLSTAPGAIDRLVFVSYDGTNWYGDLIGKGYA